MDLCETNCVWQNQLAEGFPFSPGRSSGGEEVRLRLPFRLKPCVEGISRWRRAYHESMLSPGNSATATWYLTETLGDPHGPHCYEAARLGQ